MSILKHVHNFYLFWEKVFFRNLRAWIAERYVPFLVSVPCCTDHLIITNCELNISTWILMISLHSLLLLVLLNSLDTMRTNSIHCASPSSHECITLISAIYLTCIHRYIHQFVDTHYTNRFPHGSKHQHICIQCIYICIQYTYICIQYTYICLYIYIYLHLYLYLYLYICMSIYT